MAVLLEVNYAQCVRLFVCLLYVQAGASAENCQQGSNGVRFMRGTAQPGGNTVTNGER